MRCWRSPRTLALLVLVTLSVLVLTAASDGFFYGGRGPQFFFNGQPMGSDRGPVDNQGYYDCLGVSKGADDNAIKKAYRRLAVKLHPDKEGGDPERFKELGEAYAVLSDPDKRRTYDQYGKAALDGSGGGSAPQSTDFAEDIFSALFGGGGGRRRGGAGGAGGGFRSAPRAPDATYELEVPLADLYSGATRRVRVWTQKVGGGGGAPVRAPKDVDIVIERGMRAGAAVVLKGEQDPGIPGIAPGDLVFVLREAPPDANGGGFTRVGDHLVVDVELTLAEALLGFCRPLCHLDGTTIKVRGGRRGEGGAVKPGDLRRLRGRGMPKQGRPGEFGDLYLRFSVMFPSEDEIAHWTQEQRDKLAGLLPQPPEFPWKEGAGASTATEAAVEPPDPLVARAIDRGVGGGSGQEQGDASSFFRFFNL